LALANFLLEKEAISMSENEKSIGRAHMELDVSEVQGNREPFPNFDPPEPAKKPASTLQEALAEARRKQADPEMYGLLVAGDEGPVHD
jgi:hypothetical protein